MVYLENDRIILRYFRMGQVVGEDVFLFFLLIDIGIKILDEFKFDFQFLYFGMKFYVFGFGEKIFVLIIGSNFLIYDEKVFKIFIYRVFEVLINGVKVKFFFVRMCGGVFNMDVKWEDGIFCIVIVRLVRKNRCERNIIVLIFEGKFVFFFFDMEDLDIEEIEMDNKKVEVWKIKYFYEKESVVLYFFVEDKKVCFYILRYFFIYRKDYVEFLIKVFEEFLMIKVEF